MMGLTFLELKLVQSHHARRILFQAIKGLLKKNQNSCIILAQVFPILCLDGKKKKNSLFLYLNERETKN